MSARGNGGNWNRAGRRSGGSRPFVIDVLAAARPETDEEHDARVRRELLDGIRRRSPIDLIAAYILRDEPDVAAALKAAGVNYDKVREPDYGRTRPRG